MGREWVRGGVCARGYEWESREERDRRVWSVGPGGREDEAIGDMKREKNMGQRGQSKEVETCSGDMFSPWEGVPARQREHGCARRGRVSVAHPKEFRGWSGVARARVHPCIPAPPHRTYVSVMNGLFLVSSSEPHLF